MPAVSSVLARTLTLCFALTTFTAFAQTDVDLETYTNGFDADTAPGPTLVAGSTVTWTYVVSNTSSRELNNVVVTDDQGVSVTCPSSVLDAGFTMTCSATGIAVAGQYANVGTVTATMLDATVVTDSDPSHYFGAIVPSLSFEKRTNGFDADTPPGVSVPAGTAVLWEYVITNVGTEALMDISVSDDRGVAVSCPQTTLAVNASMTCTANGIAQVGQYANVGSVRATLADSQTNVSESDPSHYYGQTLSLEKRTNGIDVSNSPGPLLTPGDPVTWTYAVTNHGPAAISNLTVVDDQGVTVLCPQTTIAGDQTVTCSATGTVQRGQYVNVATANAQLPAGGVVTAFDSSFYVGNVISIEKRTNGDDADTAPGPSVVAGSTVNWTYELTNSGPNMLDDISVTDDQGVVVNCPASTLDAGMSMTCTASGAAILGQYTNVGTVRAHSVGLGALVASDSSHYFGVPPSPSISATKADALQNDVDHDGVVEAGDTLRYTVVITNSGTGPATAVMFNDTPDVHTTLVVSSVTTTAGTVTSGNIAGETNVAVSVGTLAVGESATITFDVRINDPLPPGTISIANQGSVSGSNFTTTGTDDPAAGGGADATITAVAPAPTMPVPPVPALATWALCALATLLAFAAFRAMN